MNALKLAVVIALATTASAGLALNHRDGPSKAELPAGNARMESGDSASRLRRARSHERAQEALPLLWIPAGRAHDALPGAGFSCFPAPAGAACTA